MAVLTASRDRKHFYGGITESPDLVCQQNFPINDTDLAGRLILHMTEHFGFVDRVHVSCIAQTCGTIDFCVLNSPTLW